MGPQQRIDPDLLKFLSKFAHITISAVVASNEWCRHSPNGQCWSLGVSYQCDDRKLASPDRTAKRRQLAHLVQAQRVRRLQIGAEIMLTRIAPTTAGASFAPDSCLTGWRAGKYTLRPAGGSLENIIRNARVRKYSRPECSIPSYSLRNIRRRIVADAII